MDEPTTHLDLSSTDALAFALDQFQGTLIFISHDVYFIRTLANHVVHVNAGQLSHYTGGYQYYLDKTKMASGRAGLTSAVINRLLPPEPFGGSSRITDRASRNTQYATRNTLDNSSGTDQKSSTSRKDQKRLEAQQRQARSRQRKEQQQLVQRLETEIQQLETLQTELTVELEKPETYNLPGRPQQLSRQLLDLRERLQIITAEWETAATRLAAIDVPRL
jgi:ATP-binding cassette subfamily F protein 3